SNTLNNEVYYYGRLTLGGLDHLIGMFLKLINNSFKTAYHSISPILQNPIVIGEGKTFNAFYTSIMNHYLDFILIGVLIFPLFFYFFGLLFFSLFFCMFVAYCFYLFFNNHCIVTLSLLTFILYNAVTIILLWHYQQISTWITLFILFAYIIIEKNKNKHSSKI